MGLFLPSYCFILMATLSSLLYLDAIAGILLKGSKRLSLASLTEKLPTSFASLPVVLSKFTAPTPFLRTSRSA